MTADNLQQISHLGVDAANGGAPSTTPSLSLLAASLPRRASKDKNKMLSRNLDPGRFRPRLQLDSTGRRCGTRTRRPHSLSLPPCLSSSLRPPPSPWPSPDPF